MSKEKKSSKLKEFSRGLFIFGGTSLVTGVVIGAVVVLIRAGVEGQVDLPFLQRSLDFLLNNWESVVVPSLFGGMIIGGMTTVAMFAPTEGNSGSVVIDDKGEHLEDEPGEENTQRLEKEGDFTKNEKIGVIRSHASLLAGDADFEDTAKTVPDTGKEKEVEKTNPSAPSIKSGKDSGQ